MTRYQRTLVGTLRGKPLRFLAGVTLVFGAQYGMRAHAAAAQPRTAGYRVDDAARGLPADLCTLVQRREILPFLARGRSYTMHVNQAPMTRYVCIYEVKYTGRAYNYDHVTIALGLNKTQLLADGDYKPFRGVGNESYLHRHTSDSPAGSDLAELLVRKDATWFVMSVEFDVAGKRSALVASEALARRVLARL
jgi:hypothetical protein